MEVCKISWNSIMKQTIFFSRKRDVLKLETKRSFFYPLLVMNLDAVRLFMRSHLLRGFSYNLYDLELK